jgi:outer membrane protein TolC
MRYLLPLLLPLSLLAQSSDPQLHEGRDVLPLSLKKAVELALAPEGNTRLQLAREAIRQSQAREAEARSALLPDVTGGAYYESMTQNLAARGIRFQSPIPGFGIPVFVGPFSVFDARASVTQSVFDFSTVRRYQAAKMSTSAVKADSESTTEQTMEQVARAYLAALHAQAVLDTARANVKLSEELKALAVSQHKAGSGTGIEVTRADVQLANDEQRLTVAESDLERARLQLLRVIGLNLDAKVDLTDALGYVPIDEPTVQQAMVTAQKSRAELTAQDRREKSAQLNYSSVKYERFPVISAFGDYGSSGAGLETVLPTRTYGMQMRVPLFDGGRREARRVEAMSQLKQEQIRTHDLKEQVLLDIKLALESLRSAEKQVKTAEAGLLLAEDELKHAQTRYKAGVSSNIEVTDAQTRVARARENRVSALFNHNLARIDLTAAMGTVERIVQ